MTRSAQQITAFTGGEISPRLNSRINSERYQNGCKVLENWIVHPHGGASRRMGWQDLGILNNESIVVPLQQEENDLAVVISQVNIEMFDGDNSIGIVAASPYAGVDLDDLYIAQDEDVLEVVTDTVAPHQLKLVDGSWVFEPSPFVDKPQHSFNDTLSPGGNDASFDLTLSGSWVSFESFNLTYNGVTTDILLYRPDATFMINRIRAVLLPLLYEDLESLGLTAQDVLTVTEQSSGVFRMDFVGIADVLPITIDVTNVSSVSGTATVSAGSSSSSSSGSPEDAWSDARGWPRTVVFHEQRKIYGGTRSLPATLWGTRTGAATDGIFTIGQNDNDAFVFRIKSQKPMAIRWLSAKRLLAVGTTAGDVVQFASPISPTNVDFKRQTANQSRSIAPVEANSETLYVIRGGRKVRNLLYDFGSQGWRSIDVTFPSQHLTKGRIRSFAWTAEPDGIMWCALEDGSLVGMTYEQTQDVVAWHRHPFDGVIRSIAVVHQNGLDQLWAVVQREGSWRIARMPATSTEDYSDYAWLDLWTRRTLTQPQGAIGGLVNYEGQTVRVLVDNKDQGLQEVVNGTVTTTEEGLVFDVGYDYIATLRTNPYEGGAFGTAQIAKRSWSNMFVRLVDSLLPQINGETPPDRAPDAEMDAAQPLVSGDITAEGTSYGDGSIEIIAARPGPCNVTGIFGVLRVGNG
ncbi:MAG: hypothetical protein QNK05_20135 [Myxococcota bacterium]|nr:hypothetical protein [Myxococcota bacterium]